MIMDLNMALTMFWLFYVHVKLWCSGLYSFLLSYSSYVKTWLLTYQKAGKENQTNSLLSIIFCRVLKAFLHSILL